MHGTASCCLGALHQPPRGPRSLWKLPERPFHPTKKGSTLLLKRCCLRSGFSTQGYHSVTRLLFSRMVSNLLRPHSPPLFELLFHVPASAPASLIAFDSCVPTCHLHPPQSDFDF